MEGKESITIHRAVINKAISYIFDHLDEDITVDDVADHCAYSKYHLNRIFKEDTEEALYQFIKRVRLERSAGASRWKKKKVLQKLAENMGILRPILPRHLRNNLLFLRQIIAKAVNRWWRRVLFPMGLHWMN